MVFESAFHDIAIPEVMSAYLSLSAVAVLTSCIGNLNDHLSQRYNMHKVFQHIASM